MDDYPIIDVSDLLRASHIKRWHIVQTSRGQTLAEHCYNVTTIALALYDKLVGIDVDAASHEICILAISALYHDATEIRTGDIPTPGKRLIKHFGVESIFNNLEQQINPEVPFLHTPHRKYLNNFIKMADSIDAAVWIRENGVGARAQEVAARCWHAMEELVQQLTTETGGDWHTAVNGILTAMLAPRLSSNLS